MKYKMDYKKGCQWVSDPINDAMLESLPCVKEKGADEKTCAKCSFKKV